MAYSNKQIYLLLLATRSSSSFFLIAKLLLLPLAAFMSSSARHSATVLTLRKAAFLAPCVISQMAWLTRRMGETSHACRRTDPARPIFCSYVPEVLERQKELKALTKNTFPAFPCGHGGPCSPPPHLK